MLLGRRFDQADIVVLDDLSTLCQSENAKQRTMHFIAHLATKMNPGESLPEQLSTMLAEWRAERDG
jgi:hypothetical protein